MIGHYAARFTARRRLLCVTVADEIDDLYHFTEVR